MSAEATLDHLRETWIASNSDSDKDELVAFMDTTEYITLPYHIRGKGFITSSKLRTYNRIPYEANLAYELGVSPDWDEKKCLTMGRAMDECMDEKISFDAYVACNRTTTEGKQLAQEALDAGKKVITPKEMEKIERGKLAFIEHPLFPQSLQKANILWLWAGKYPCKAELDHLEMGELIFDLKFVGSLPRFNIMEYYIQAEFYYAAVLEGYLQKLPVRFGVVDQGTHCAHAHAWEFCTKTLDAGQGRLFQLVQDYSESMASDIWPSIGDPNDIAVLERFWKSDYYSMLPDHLATKPTIV